MLDITHVGTTCVDTKNGKLHLHNGLVVTEIKKSLLCISQITTEHAYLFEFTCDGFVIKHNRTGTVITLGERCSDLYVLRRRRNWGAAPKF